MIQYGLTKSEGGGDFSKDIDFATGNKGFCHGFLWIPQYGKVFEAHIKYGVRFIDRSPDPDREILFEFPNLTPEREALILWKAMGLSGDDYDVDGIFRKFIGAPKLIEGKEWCIPALILAGKSAGYWKETDAAAVWPNELLDNPPE